jgi:hypothetical protein
MVHTNGRKPLWQDKEAMRTIDQFRQEFGLKLVVETGSHVGESTEVLAYYFDKVLSCEIDLTYYLKAIERTKNLTNVEIEPIQSDIFLKSIGSEPAYFFLDAHPFNNSAGTDWPIEKEIPALGKRDNCVICIHDYDNGELGFIYDDNRKLDWSMVGHLLKEVNPNFHYYTNTKEFCDIVDEVTVKEVPVTVDADIIDCIRHSINGGGDVTKYRGILYAVPKELDLTKYKLVEYHE